MQKFVAILFLFLFVSLSSFSFGYRSFLAQGGMPIGWLHFSHQRASQPQNDWPRKGGGDATAILLNFIQEYGFHPV